MSQVIRPTKKQQELLVFVDDFIRRHGYSPSYREIMKSLGYNSVATVSLHINNLIKRGHMIKRDHSARSLEVVHQANTKAEASSIVPKQLNSAEEKWLVQKVEIFFKEVEKSTKIEERELDQLYVLIGALKVLGLDGAAQAYIPRLTVLKKKLTNSQYVV